MAADVPAAAGPGTQDEILEGVDNPIERLKLLSGNDDEAAKYLDAIEGDEPTGRAGASIQQFSPWRSSSGNCFRS